MNPRDDWPPRLRRALANPSAERQAWSGRLAGVLIAAYLWAAYPDAIATTTLAVGGLAASVGGAALGGALAAALLFVAPAMQGLRTRQPLMVVATSAFGVRGSSLVPGLLVGLVQIVWFAVAVHYAVAFNLQGLHAAGLIDEADIRPARADGSITQSTVYAATAMLWAVASALVATRFIRWIAALMVVYPIFMAMALGGAMLWALPGLPAYRAAEADPAIAAGLSPGRAFWGMAQFVFGFSATVAAQSVNWGATLRGPSDVRRAGLVGVGFASVIVAVLAVLTVAGALGRDRMEPGANAGGPDAGAVAEEPAGSTSPAAIPLPARPSAYTLGTVFEDRIGGVLGGIGLIVLGLGSLASAVYASYAYSNRLESIRKRPRRWAWGVVGAFVAYPLMVTGLAANVPLVVDLTAGLMAPMLGVLAADALAQRGAWPGPRPGYRWPGLAAWGAGAAVGMLPVAARVAPALGPCRWLPMAAIGFGVALAAMLAAGGLRPSPTRRGEGGDGG